jgi:hypothetical protein
MTDDRFFHLAREDFGRARKKEIVGRILNMLNSRKDEMLSLGDVRSLLKPESEHYKGMHAVSLRKIVGSEGRYQDFNRAFLPRHDKLMSRWTRVDVAHYQNVNLPPIKLFEIGGMYFVRDGNHRVSVAKAKGAEFIDAEVISLESEIALHPDMGLEELKAAVINFEKKRFFQETRLAELRPGCCLEFTEVGRYDEILNHIRVHKWYKNMNKSDEIPFSEAVVSWYDEVYVPIVRVIQEVKLLSRFPRATESDLYVFIGKHWSELGKRYGPIFTLEEAAEDFSAQAKHKGIARVVRILGGLGKRLVDRIWG